MELQRLVEQLVEGQKATDRWMLRLTWVAVMLSAATVVLAIVG